MKVNPRGRPRYQPLTNWQHWQGPPPQGSGHHPLFDSPPRAKHAAPPALRPKRPHWLLVALFIGVLCLLLASCGVAASTAEAQDSDAPGPAGIVTYEVGGPGPAGTITYADGTRGTTEVKSVRLPWRKEIPVERGLTVTTLSAQNKSAGDIWCRISLNGAVVKEARAAGQFAVASCTGPLS